GGRKIDHRPCSRAGRNGGAAGNNFGQTVRGNRRGAGTAASQLHPPRSVFAFPEREWRGGGPGRRDLDPHLSSHASGSPLFGTFGLHGGETGAVSAGPARPINARW